MKRIIKNRKSLKKITALVLSATLSLPLAGCGATDYLKGLFEEDEITKLKELDYTRAYHLHYNGDKVITVDEIINDNFQFTKEDSELGEDGKYQTSLETKTYKIVKKDNIKYLIDAKNCDVVYLYGFETLGTPFYLQYYDAKNGGQDSTDGLSGYVLPYTDSEGNTYLVDFDTFEPLLSGVNFGSVNNNEEDSDNVDETEEEILGNSRETARNYLENNSVSLDFYSQANGGIDEEGIYSGYVFEITKNGIHYLVDCTHLDKIIVSNYKGNVEIHNETDPGYIEITSGDDKKVQYLEDALLVETESETLKKRL